jgi:hypothetical protein
LYDVADAPRQLHFWGRVIALATGLIALALNVAATVVLFEPQATYGYQLVYTNGFEVAVVDPATPADRARVAPGDHLDFRKSTLHDRILGLAYEPARLGERVKFFLVGRHGIRPITLRADLLTASELRQALFSPLASFLRLTGFIYIAVALMILLRRPNRMTLGLSLYLLSATVVTSYRVSDAIFPFAELGSDWLAIVGPIGLIIFAARFPGDLAAGWRSWLDRSALPLGVLFAVPNFAWDVNALFLGIPPSAWMLYGATIGALVLVLIAGATIVSTYLRAAGLQRQRFVWVIAGILFSLLSYVSAWARYWSTTFWLASFDPIMWTATVLYACAPFAIAYAVVRQRVFDISFVVSRTLVYTIVTAAIFGTFALLHWLTIRLVEHTGAAVILVALTAVGLAYSINRIYLWAVRLVDSTLFRRRHEAERHIAEVAAGLARAQSAAAVEDALVREPLRAYSLTSADLFRRNALGDYVGNGRTLDASITRRLHGLRRALALHEGDPVLAVPVFVRDRLEAVAVYGAHRSGEDIDPAEARSLEAICTAAGLAYNHLEAARAQHAASRWRKLAEHQARELAALRERVSLLGKHFTGDDAHGNRSM